MSEELLKKVPVETRWSIAGQTFTAAYTAFIQLLMPVVGREKLIELNNMIYGPGAKMAFPEIKKAFNITTDDAIGVNNLAGLVVYLQMGPEFEFETVEESPEKVVARTTKCPWWDRAQEQGGKPEDMICPEGHTQWSTEGAKAVLPKCTFKMTKTMPWGDPYCEFIWEIK
jgi:hypothetical protein